MKRQLRGQIRQVTLDDLELQSNSVLKQATIHPLAVELVPLVANLFPFLFPPSYFSLIDLPRPDHISSSLACPLVERRMTLAVLDGREETLLGRRR